MNTRRFMTGLGIGMVAGGAVGMMVTNRMHRSDGKKVISRALKGMGSVIDDVSAMMGR